MCSSGVSVPHMFVVTFVIMLPIATKTGDPVKGWEAGLTWVFVQSFVLMAGGFIAPVIRRIPPRAALLGTLAGVSIAFISMRPALDMFTTPLIGITCFAIILVSWFGGVQYFRGRFPPVSSRSWLAASSLGDQRSLALTTVVSACRLWGESARVICRRLGGRPMLE